MSHPCYFFYRTYNFEQRIVLAPLYAIAPVVTTGYHDYLHDPDHPDRTVEEFFEAGEPELAILGAYANSLFETCELVNANMNNLSVEEYVYLTESGRGNKLDYMPFWMRFARTGQRTGYYGDSVLVYSPIEKGWEKDFAFDPTYENILLTYNFLEEKIRQFESLRDEYYEEHPRV